VADIHARGDHLNTGATAPSLLLPVLTDHGDVDLAYEIATQTTYPSWGYWLTEVATTSWETWVAHRSQPERGPRLSRTFEDWLYQYLAGIQPAAPGYAKVRGKPVTPTGFNFVSARITTPRGEVSSTWRRVRGGIRLEVHLRAQAIPVSIGDGVWLGGPRHCLPRAFTIGTGTVVGAGGTVTRDSPANVVAVGNPCRVIRHL
jgi:hypothetical protein